MNNFSSKYRIEKLTPKRYVDYEKFILSKMNTLLFHSIKYQELLSETINTEIETIILLDQYDKIQGTIPLASKNGRLGKIYNSLPFYGSNGGIISEDPQSFEILKKTIENFQKYDPEFSLLMISENPLEPLANIKSELTENRICQFSKLDFKTEEDLLNSFHYKTRNVIRKAMKQKIEIVEDNAEINFLYKTHLENMNAVGGNAKPRIFFDKINKYFKAGEEYKIFIAKKDGVPTSALLLFYYNNIVEYFTPVIKTEYRSLQSNSLLIFNAMKEASTKGCRLWNWGGTWKSQVDLFRFKSRWGASSINYNYYLKVENKKLFDSKAIDLIQEYPYFYTLPFNLLNESK